MANNGATFYVRGVPASGKVADGVDVLSGVLPVGTSLLIAAWPGFDMVTVEVFNGAAVYAPTQFHKFYVEVGANYA